MIRFDPGEDALCGLQGEERVAVFAGLDDGGGETRTLRQTGGLRVAGLKFGTDIASRGVPGLMQDPPEHSGSCGFSMGAGHAELWNARDVFCECHGEAEYFEAAITQSGEFGAGGIHSDGVHHGGD